MAMGGCCGGKETQARNAEGMPRDADVGAVPDSAGADAPAIRKGGLLASALVGVLIAGLLLMLR